MKLIGFIGSILLAICGFPEAYDSLRGIPSGIGWTMLLVWFVGEIMTLAYILAEKQSRLVPLIFNYGLNILFIGIIIYYKVNL